MLKTPKTLLEAVRYYSSEVVCVEFLSSLKWDGGVKRCPKCDSMEVYGLRTRPVFKCRSCKKQFSIKVGTIMQDSPLPITKWVPAIWMVVNCKNGISSCEMARALGITQKSAWHLNHRIRQAIANGTMQKLSGTVEADESYFGGKEKNKHAWKRNSKRGRNTDSKQPVIGIVERGGNVVAKTVTDVSHSTVMPFIGENVELGSIIMTDEFRVYGGMKRHFNHKKVNHKEGEYVKGDAHTNNIECYWSLVKRMISGTYVHVEPFHLDRYLQEQSFRYNERKGHDSNRFEQVASQVFGTTLTYAKLTGKLQ